MDKIIDLARELGYEGQELRDFISRQQDRESERLKFEAIQKDKDLEKFKIEAERGSQEYGVKCPFSQVTLF